MYSSQWYTRRRIAITMTSVATPEKIAPTTKRTPKMLVFHPTRSVMPKIHDTTVCTDTAMGMMTTMSTAIPRVRAFF